MKSTKGGRILTLSVAVVLVWSLITIIASFHAIHYDNAVLVADNINAHQDSRQKEESTVKANSLQRTDNDKTLVEVRNGNRDPAALLRGSVDRHKHMGNTMFSPGSIPERGVSPLLMPRTGGARSAILEELIAQRQAKMKEANLTAVSQLQPASHFQEHGLTPGQEHLTHVSAKRMGVQRPHNHLLPKMYHHAVDFMMASRASSARILEMEPKRYDTALLQSQPTICAERNLTSKLCTMRPCRDGEIGHHDNDDDNNAYGFVMHQRNTRGAVPLTNGAARSGSGCAISHKYKFVFIHVLKSGGTTMKGFLKRGLCGGDDGPPKTCPGVLEIVDCRGAVLGYPHYFVFSFVRNPFDRTYSAYSMAESMRGEHQKERNSTFEDFVFMDKAERKRFSLTSPAHYLPQVNFLFGDARCPVVDYIGRLERFGTDLQVVLNYIQSPELQAYYDKQKQERHGDQSSIVRENCTSFGERKKAKELDGKLSNAYRSKDMIQAVASEFAVDFRFLRYDDTNIQ